MKDPVKDKLKRFELFERFGAASSIPTVGAAVDAYLEEHAVDRNTSRSTAQEACTALRNFQWRLYAGLDSTR